MRPCLFTSVLVCVTTIQSMKKPNFRALITLLSNNDPRGEQIVASETVIDMDSEFYCFTNFSVYCVVICLVSLTSRMFIHFSGLQVRKRWTIFRKLFGSFFESCEIKIRFNDYARIYGQNANSFRTFPAGLRYLPRNHFTILSFHFVLRGLYPS